MPDDPKRPLKVFLCHAHPDADKVRALYARLKREGVDVWLDKEKLLPGADWEYEIRKAVREADVVVVCLSKQFNQAGFRQKEVRIALDAAMEKPEGEIFIIPARLEECDNLESLNKWHWVDLFESDGLQRLMLALRVRADKIGAALRQRGGHTVSRPKITPEQEAAEKAAREKEAVEKAAREKARLEAEEQARQKAAKEEADREAEEKNARGRELAEKALRAAGMLGAQQAAKDKVEKEVAAKAHLEAEELARQKAAKEKADREAADAARIAREKAEKDAREKTAREKARLEAEELERQRLAREKAERRKTPRKPNTAIITGGIGLVGIICIAVISSLWGDLFPRAPEPTATLFLTPTKTKTPAPTKTPTATAFPDEITENGVPMRLVPAGEFEMGSTNGESDETPVHTVYLDDFYMDKYEVTNALYKTCVDAGGCKTPPQNTSSYTRDSYYGNPEFDDYPVIYVDWNQAQAYCQWRDASLPTEAQWEKAARGTDERIYPWGEGIDCDKANYSGCKGDTTKVGSYESGQSPYGIYDLAGNVWEWTADWYSETYYQSSPSENPLGPDSGQYRMLRGGSCGSYGNNVRSSDRNWNLPTGASYGIGFRCSRSQP